MDSHETEEFDETRITPESRLFATDLFARFPDLRAHAAMERGGEHESWSLVVDVFAPSGDPSTRLHIWVDGGDNPSVEFGGWHTHEHLWGTDDPRGALFDLIEAIRADRFVLCEDIGGRGDGVETLLDLSERDALVEELTSKHSPGRVRLRSWSGRYDRVVSLDDLDREERDRPRA